MTFTERQFIGMKSSYLMRLDDACEYRDIDAWRKIEIILDRYNIKPLVGIIPHCEDKELMRYGYDDNFWDLAVKWQNKGWEIALHGFNHVYSTNSGGINPVNQNSEFASVDYETQCEKIRKGIEILSYHKIKANVFFAPSHTFDKNTLKALKTCSDIRIISDCIASAPYYEDEFYFVPQQTGKPRKLPFRVVTICLHPNIMDDKSFKELEDFLEKEHKQFVSFKNIDLNKRKLNIYDRLLRTLYFGMRKIRARQK